MSPSNGRARNSLDFQGKSLGWMFCFVRSPSELSTIGQTRYGRIGEPKNLRDRGSSRETIQ